MKKTFYKWAVLQNGEIVNYGIEEEPIEIPVERIFPSLFSFADRSLDELQAYADQHLKSENYIFRYKEIEIDFSNLEVY